MPPSTLYGLQGGFLLDKNGSVTGQAVYSVSGIRQDNNQWAVCNSGTATIAGIIQGQTATLTAIAGSQTFSLSGTIGSDRTITNATFTTTGGTAAGFITCGIPTTTGLSWSAASVPSLTGPITGTFHSTETLGASGLRDQTFPVTGSFTQGPNIGASNATITGTLSFVDSATLLSLYPCLSDGLLSVNGQISGTSVILHLIATEGSNVGQIGNPVSATNTNTVQPVAFNSTANGPVLQSQTAPAYVVNTKPCPFPGGSSDNHEDSGNICLALKSSACQQPITLSPTVLIFPSQVLGTTSTVQTIKVTNVSGGLLSNLTWTPQNDDFSDFTGQGNFTFATTQGDPCDGVGPQSGTFSLDAGQSCTFKVTFAPQESCAWQPFGAPPTGAPPAQCPIPLTASLTIQTLSSPDNDTSYRVPITGSGISFVQPSVSEIDFGAEAVGERSLSQTLSFTNHGANPVQILHARNSACQFSDGVFALPFPLTDDGSMGGLQVVTNDDLSVIPSPGVGPAAVFYRCDGDPQTHVPNFQISSDTCTGTLLAPQATCGLQIAFAPQPQTALGGHGAGLDYFLELNTVQCTNAASPLSPPGCEIDAGRFAVELRANLPSPLRMAPGAGLDFGVVPVGTSSVQQTVTLFNDPADPQAAAISFSSRVVASGNYSETDDCPFALAPGSSCTITVTFKPKSTGLNQGTLTINYTTDQTVGPQVQTVYLRGTGQ
jgi:hypothetical protein